ncbi:hypothetical protein GR160_08860 [Flavobacterium sp. Sd200]|uniref:hypothetical protein n=1 Tax=Flavobacterium sp. Sd200 TaxID=2692211 RepID=UPI001370BB30|nr:hypothetical protein [Flavobacterium sp. Sd200]MXN91338.1 hypothetical protein [Flavobacterium sp. Sd200]
MKKTLLILLLLSPLFAMAKFYEGQVTLADGSVKAGFINIIGSDTKIKFKSGEDADTEKIKIEDIKELYIINGSKIEFVSLYLADLHPTKGYIASKKKYLVRIHRKGKINLVSYYMDVAPIGPTPRYTARHFYFQKQGADTARFIYTSQKNLENEDYHVRAQKTIEKVAAKQFEEECPDMIANLNSDAFKEKGLPYLIELYEQYCGK